MTRLLLNKKLLAALAIGLLMFGMIGVASASVIYNFEAFSSYDNGIGNISGTFSLTVPTFISSDTSFTPSELDASSIHSTTDSSLVLGDVSFQLNLFGPYDAIGFGGSGVTMLYYFDHGAFAAVGSYDTVVFGTDQAAHLNVSETGATVPEPSTFVLLGVAVGGLAIWRRTKRQ